MDKKQLVVVHVLFCVICSHSKREIDYGGVRDGLQTGSYYAEQLTEGLVAGNILQSIQNILGLASQIHPIVGAVAGALYFVLSIFGAVEQTEDPLTVAIREGVTVICRKLDRISDAIRDLEYEIKFEIRGLSLEHQVDDIEGLLLVQQQLVEKRDNESIDDFVNSCMVSRIYEKPYWFTKVLTSQSPNNLKYLIISERDASQLNDFYQRMVSMFFQSVILSSSCTAAYFMGESNETVQFYLDRKSDHAEYLLKQIHGSMKIDADLLTSTFIQDSLTNVVKAAEKYEDEDIQLPFQDLNYTLNRKYNYRSWLVIVYGDSDTYGHAKHSTIPDKDNELIYNRKGNCDGYFRNFIRFHGTNYAIGTPSNCTVDLDWKKRADYCTTQITSRIPNCSQLEKLKDCLEDRRLDYLVIGCVKERYYAGVGDGNLVMSQKPGMVMFVLK